MKISIKRKILKEDLTRYGELPEWLDPMLQVINDMLDTMTRALTNNLSFYENIGAQVYELKMTSGTALKITPNGNRSIYGLQILEVLNKAVTSHSFIRNSDGTLSVTINWTGGGDAVARFALLLK